MLANNRYKFSKLATTIGTIDSTFIRENFGKNQLISSSLHSLIKKEFDNVGYRNEERKFLDNVVSILQKRITDSSFDFMQFAIEMKVSKSTLYRKINELTGFTPCKLVNLYRTEVAQQLLKDNSLNISEVAYRIGFNDPRYFSRCFKNEIGLSPKEYRESIKHKNLSMENQSNDELFLKRALVKLESKISDGNLSFDEFADEMNLSKASLYRKLKSVAGLAPCEFIRSVRMKRSTQLLAKHRNISDVAFAVGFNDSKYFSRCFKSEFGITPTQYQELLDC